MIVGIDLGTTNSLVSIFSEGRPLLIPNALGDFATPSAVALDESGRILVGLAARERASVAPGSAMQAFKRWMGTDRRLRLGQKEYRPEELSALVLQALKADAEAFLGMPVTEAVITVPAYFNEAQRRATRTAGELAGLKVERLLNEPTAAGLAYGLQERPESSFLVFDLGGGTFDVSVLEYFDGVVEVRASAGDTRLGGEDFVQVLGRLFAEGQADLDATARQALLDSGAWWRAAEQAKRDLSEQERTTMRLLQGDRRLELEITRAAFEAASAELLQRLRRPIERALQDAQIEPQALTEVVLVGGATRMPMIRQLCTRLFHRLPLRTIDPDLAIAQGAAVQAGLKARDAALEEVVLTDVMPYSLGVIAAQQLHGGQMVHNRFAPVIERNTPVPVSRVERFESVVDDQKTLLLDVRQGESPIGSENLHLGKLEIPLEPARAGQAKLDVRFSYDANGLLEVDVREAATGRTHQLLIRNAATQMSEAEIAAALDRLRLLKRHPRDEEDNRYLIERAKRLYEERLGEERSAIQAWLAQFETVLDQQDTRAARVARHQFRQALDSIDSGFRF